ncbi:hypothetical protein [Tropicibacter sp. S64]|uniref:hypothetical protein n=1 Tax=Tropicibacter sp. S64 TaxID=3415122 RepID=UPI003C7DF7E2
MKIHFAAAVLLVASGTSAGAACAPEDLFLSCKIAGKSRWLEVCVEQGNIVYRYGKQGAPELELREHPANVAYMPWPGIGGTIWEEVEFANGEYGYLVHGAIDKQLAVSDAPGAVSGGVEVLKGGQSVASLSCDPAQVDFPWGDALMRAKEAVGMTWDPGEQMWQHGQ